MQASLSLKLVIEFCSVMSFLSGCLLSTRTSETQGSYKLTQIIGLVAVGIGFEPMNPEELTVQQTAAFSHSANLPYSGFQCNNKDYHKPKVYIKFYFLNFLPTITPAANITSATTTNASKCNVIIYFTLLKTFK